MFTFFFEIFTNITNVVDWILKRLKKTVCPSIFLISVYYWKDLVDI